MPANTAARERQIYRDLATGAIREYERAAKAHATAAHLEAETEAHRPEQKCDAIRRIMARENPLTGKPHSATSAEAVVETDEYYAQFLAGQRRITSDRMERAAEATAARLRAQLYTECLGVPALDAADVPEVRPERAEMAVVR